MYLGDQAYSSAETSLCQTPATVGLVEKRYGWEPRTINFDIGAGKCPDMLMLALDAHGVDLIAYDPYHFTDDYNAGSLELVEELDGTDTVTVNNVLNVIKEPTERAKVIRMAFQALKPGGRAYFLIHEGKRDSRGRRTSRGWQNNKKAEKYVPEIETVFDQAHRHGKLIVGTKLGEIK
jgi:SAM-dependent methyltransferase